VGDRWRSLREAGGLRLGLMVGAIGLPRLAGGFDRVVVTVLGG
jgi:hypothetical protein